ncbi:Glutaredoxin-3 [Halotydeus destructor]|nr:Glutaredoxin-3 [Halotydeus destructor]
MSVELVDSKVDLDAIVGTSNKNLVVVHFWASWAPQCQQISDVLTELAKNKDIGLIRYVQVDAEKLQDAAKQFNVSSVPTVVLIASNKVVGLVEGADVPQLTKKVKEVAFKYFPFTVASIPTSATEKTDINDRLKQLINESPLMMFMKGSPDAPRCGFSRQLIAIVNETGIPYKTFDILSDEEVRQGLKMYSNWPTYPQVYVNGNLVGGLDIIKELQGLGELEATLKGEV